MGRTLQRYLFLQVLGPFAAGLALFTFVLLIARIMKLVELVVNRGVPTLQILLLFSYILPAFLEVTVPMALLLACLMACGRLSADSEYTALRSSGISLYQFATPIAAFAGLICAVSIFLSVYTRPWGNAALREGIFDLARTRASVGLKEHVFNDEFKDLVIYVEEIEPPGSSLKRILISDRRVPGEPNTVLARRGTLMANEESHSVNLRLYDGVIFTGSPTDQHAYHKTDFSVYDVSLNLDEALGQLETRTRDPSEIPLAELRSRIRELGSQGEPALAERVELNRRFSVPFATLVFALIGVPLGLQPVRAVRSRGLAVSLVVILVYYLLLTGAETLGQGGHVSIPLAMWTPNIVLGSVGIFLFLREAREKSFSLFDRLGFAAQSVRERMLEAIGRATS
jgi:lipopolysaccharide export system permease protein